jgi:hypothetical protein
VTVGPHAQAFLTLLAAGAGTPALVVYDGAVPSSPTPTPPYVVAYFTITTPDEAAVGMEAVPDWVDCAAYVHCVGGNASASRAVAGRVRAALLGAQPTVSGRSCTRVRHTESQPPQRDESTGRLVFSLVDVYQFRSLPG